jgi:Na+/phosphate symporter
MINILLALLICIIGAFLYLAASNPKVAQLGLWAFAVGLFWTLAEVPHHVTHLFD